MAEQHSESAQADVIEVPCPLCGCESVEELWSHTSGVTNGVCRECGHVHLSRRLPDIAIAESYEEYGQHYPDEFLLDESNLLFEVARGRIGFLERHLAGFPPATLLEVGCGYGHFLSLLAGDSDCYGIEPSKEEAAFARKMFGLGNVLPMDFESSEEHDSLRSRAFDLVCSFHVMEHLVDPVRFMEFVKRRLKPGGFVCLAVPDLDTLSPDLIELYFIARSWHLHSFSRGTMTQLLESQGFTVVAAQQEGATTMLRSSTIFLAQYDGDAQGTSEGKDVLAEAREAANRFHGELERRLAAIRQAFREWRDEGARVAVYGGGIHTRALLSLTGVTCDDVAAIIDDDPAKEGTLLFGVPVLTLGQALEQGADVVVVSSLASEDDILKRLESDGTTGEVIVRGIYRDLCCQTGKD